MSKASKRASITILILLTVLTLWGCSKSNQGGDKGGTGPNSNVVADALAQIAPQVQDGSKAKDGQSSDLATNPPKLSIDQVKASVEESVYLDGVHNHYEITCENCHGKIEDDQSIVVPKDDICMKCHEGSYEKLADKLQSIDQWKTYNPHNSAHEREVCITCHHSHGAFELTCIACHNTGKSERFH